MRVAYLNARYPAVSQTFVLAEVLELRRQGVEVDTIAIRRSDPDEVLSEADREAFDSTYAVLPAPAWRVARAHLAAFATSPSAYLETLVWGLRLGGTNARALLWQLFYFGEAMMVWHHCRQRSVRHLHVHFPNVAADVAMLVTRYGGKGWSYSLTLHGPTELYDVMGQRLPEKIARSTFAVCTSWFMRSQLLAFVRPDHHGKLHVARVGMDPRRFQHIEERVERDRLRVLTVGRLSIRKGHAVLVEALAQLVADGVDVEVTIVGEGEERPRLERMARDLSLMDRLHLVGAVGQDDITAYFGTADVFCLSSFAEGVPISLMEAMASGLPVVAPRLMGIPELVEDDVSGLLFAPARSDELADALRALAEEPERRREMGTAGRARVLEEFDVRDCTRTIASLLAEADGGPR